MTTASVPFCRLLSLSLLFAGRSTGAYWGIEGALSAPGEPYEANRFGSALEMSGTTLIVGAEATDAGSKADVGAVYSFERNAANQWVLARIFRFPEEAAGSGIGGAAAIDGNVLLIPVTTALASRVLVWERAAPGSPWVASQSLTGDRADEWFGKSVAVRGNIIVVGAEQAGTGEPNRDRAGAAYVFTRQNPGLPWTRVQKIAAPPSAGVNNLFGSDVELDGPWLTVGARRLSLAANQSGVTFVYRGTPGSYTLQHTLAPDSFYSNDQGWKTTFLRNGLLLIGSPGEKNPANTSQAWGAAFAWDLTADAPGPIQRIESPVRALNPGFGSAVAAAGDVMAIGMPDGRVTGGSVALFRRSAGTWTSAEGFSTGTKPNANIGFRVAMEEPFRVAYSAPGRSESDGPGEVIIRREGFDSPFALVVTSPATQIGTYRARLNAVIRNTFGATPYTFDYGRTTAYELGSVDALPEGVYGEAAARVTRDLDGLQFPRLESATLYHYRIRGGGMIGLDETFMTGDFDPALGEAVESPSQKWESFGPSRWEVQTATTSDGQDALKAGPLPYGGRTTLETTVIGPGTLSFRWKVSCTPTYSLLNFRDAGTMVKFISGNVDWTTENVRLGPGKHVIHWEFERTPVLSAYAETGWVDSVAWLPDNPNDGWTQWLIEYFAGPSLANPATSGPNADLDQDGLKNAVEAHFGSSPARAGANPMTVSAARETGTVSLRWPEANPTPGTTATPEWSPDGTVWLVSGQSRNGVPARTITVSYAGGGFQEARISSAGLSRVFLRLRIRTP